MNENIHHCMFFMYCLFYIVIVPYIAIYSYGYLLTKLTEDLFDIKLFCAAADIVLTEELQSELSEKFPNWNFVLLELYIIKTKCLIIQ